MDWTRYKITTAAAIVIAVIVSVILVLFVFDTPINIQNILMSEKLNGEYKIAFVGPSFTQAAYNHAFYDFYDKYSTTKKNVKIYSDLHNLTSKVTDVTPYGFYKSLFGLKEHTQKLLPKSDINVISDEDVNNGKIFDSNGTNIYDVLVYGHDEYATQKTYDNLKKFVASGGVIVFLDGNFLFVEVSYNPQDRTITLVRGHSWEYNGMYATRGISERWFNETSSWIGSNYDPITELKNANGTYTYQYLNDPFGYGPVRYEDQYVTNPDINKIFDYELNDPNHRVVTYWKPYDSGKVIVLGIYSERVGENPEFLKFYDKLLLEYALKN